MSRPADLTRTDLIEAAVSVFAARGFDSGSVREIARLANANAAAVSYHFDGKDGLYREVLRRSLAAFDTPSFDPDVVATMPRDEAVRAYVTAQLSALRRHDEFARYLRIFAWETVSRTPVFADFLAHERLPVVEVARAIILRYLADATAEQQNVALLWLLHQVEPFIRNPEQMTSPPFGLRLDSGFVSRLADALSTAVIAGLEALEAGHASRAVDAAA